MLHRNGLCPGGLRLSSSGFTIVEFVISLVLAAIALSLAIPALQQFSVNNQIVTANNTIVSGLNMARSAAITRGNDITICPSLNGTSCAEDNWDKGWIIFDDEDDDGTVDEGEIIRVVSIESDVNNSDFGDKIVFEADGTTGMDSNATITNCHASSDHGDACMQVTVSRFGLIESHKTMPGLGQAEGEEGS